MESVPMNLCEKSQETRPNVTRLLAYRSVVDFKVIEQVDLNARTMWDTDQWTYTG